MGVTGTVEVELSTMTGALQFIANFLNTVKPDTTQKEWRTYLKKHCAARRARGSIAFGPFYSFTNGKLKETVTLEEAKQVRQYAVSDLRYLDFDRLGIRLPSDPVDRETERPFYRTAEHPFGPLMIRLTETFKPAGWRCIALGSTMPEPGQAILRFKRRDGRVERWAASYSPIGEVRTLQEWVYAMLGKAFLSGMLGQFRMCPVCASYFVAVGKGAKRINCSDSCKEKRGASNVAERVRRSREAKRERMLKRARVLLKEGKRLREVEREVDLPDRILERLFRENGGKQ